jgi:hypothetical protein
VEGWYRSPSVMGTPLDEGKPIEALCQSMEKVNWLWAAAVEAKKRAELTRERGRSCMAWVLGWGVVEGADPVGPFTPKCAPGERADRPSQRGRHVLPSPITSDLLSYL